MLKPYLEDGSPLLPRLGLPQLQKPFERDIGRGIGLLAIDIPVAQIFQRDRLAGDGTAHEIHAGE